MASTPSTATSPSSSRPSPDGYSPDCHSPSWRSLCWHIVRKDIAHLRWAWVAWIALTTIEAVLYGYGPRLVDTSQQDTANLLTFVGSVLPPARALLFIVIVAMLVHGEPLVGTEAFWLTRPIPRRVLFASKLISAVLILVLPSMLVQLALMATFGVPMPYLAGAFVSQAQYWASLLMVALLAAALTPNLQQLMLWLLGVAIAFWTLMLIMMQVLARRMVDAQPAIPQPHDPTSGVVSSLVLGLGLAYAVWHQYRTRRPGRTLLVALGVVALSHVADEHWPGPSFFRGEPQLDAAWAGDPQRTPVRLREDIRMFSTQVAYGLGLQQQTRITQIEGPVRLDGVPSGFLVSPFTVRARVQLPNGVTLHGRRADASHTSLRLVRLGESAAVKTRREDLPWPVLLKIETDAIEKAGATIGDYTGTFQFWLTRAEPLATMPLQPHVSYRDGPRAFALWLVGERDGACMAMLRESQLHAWRDALVRVSLVPSFRDRETRQPLYLHQHYGAGFGTSLAMGGHITVGLSDGLGPFNVRYVTAAITSTEPGANPMSPTPVSCDRVEVSATRHTYAGRLWRTLSIPGFSLTPRSHDLQGNDSDD